MLLHIALGAKSLVAQDTLERSLLGVAAIVDL